jgi:hypothetical protein
MCPTDITISYYGGTIHYGILETTLPISYEHTGLIALASANTGAAGYTYNVVAMMAFKSSIKISASRDQDGGVSVAYISIGR